MSLLYLIPKIGDEEASIALFVDLLAIREASIAKAGADRKYPPMLDVLHIWDLAKSLDDGIVVHQDARSALKFPVPVSGCRMIVLHGSPGGSLLGAKRPWTPGVGSKLTD